MPVAGVLFPYNSLSLTLVGKGGGGVARNFTSENFEIALDMEDQRSMLVSSVYGNLRLHLRVWKTRNDVEFN